MLTMRSLTMFPAAFPQLTRLIMGRPVSDPKFQKERAAFLKKFAAAFQPTEAKLRQNEFCEMKKIIFLLAGRRSRRQS